MILYHGTNCEFDVIDLTKSKRAKDFGQGFYLSDDYVQALKMAQIRADLLGGTANVLSYKCEDTLLSTQGLNIKVFDNYTEEWAKFVYDNRENHSTRNIHDYDIVYGPIANDTVGYQVRKFTDGLITFQEFIEALRYMKGITFQYFFATQRAINLLTRL